MSSVVISGDTSGSVTLQAPSVAGTTVLTLPATSGTVITGPGGVVAISGGGTGQTTATAAFDALNPMTTTGDILYESSPSVAARLPIGSTGQVLTVAGGLPSWAAAGGGQLQSQVFTSPGTWTKPSSVTQVRVVVVGGGGGGNNGGGAGGNPGGTSSFGPFVSCTGGGGAPAGGGNGGDGSATVSSGTTLKSGNQRTTPIQSLGLIIGSNSPGGGGVGTYSTSDILQAGKNGSGGGGAGGGGGYAYVTGIPVTGPVSVTVGSGGPSPGTTSSGTVGGAVAVEFVG